MGWGGDRGCQYHRLRVLRAGHLLDGDRYNLVGHGEVVRRAVGKGWARVGGGSSCLHVIRLTAEPGTGEREAVGIRSGVTLRTCGRNQYVQPLSCGDVLDDQR